MEKSRIKIPIALIVFMLLVATAALLPQSSIAEDVEETTYGTLVDDSDQYNLDFSEELVKSIQKALKRKGYSISADGVFGPKTAQAVKRFQRKNGLTIDGICGPKTLKALGIDSEGITSYPRWIPNLEESFSKSTTGMALHLNLGSHKLEVYRQIDGEWKLIRVMLAATGNYKEGNYTDLTDQNIGKTKHDYISGSGWRGYYALGIQNGDFFHSVLAHRKNGKWVFDDDSALGHDVTHGCVRLKVENAQWLHQNVKPGTTCVIDDRAWDFEVTH